MVDPTVSQQVKDFIRDHISSVAQLEILLLLQTNPAQRWSSQEIARELRVEAAGAAQQLELLVATGLVVRESTGSQAAQNPPPAHAPLSPDTRYRYAPATGELHDATVAVAQAYLVRRVTVIGLIFAKPPDSLRAFSDAFRLRKDSPNEPRR